MSFQTLDFSSLFQRSNSCNSRKEDVIVENSMHRGQVCSGWVTRPEHVDMMDFALANLPSTWSLSDAAWICLRTHTNTMSTSSSNNHTSNSHEYYGKWMWFVRENEVDEQFLLLADALKNGLLGESIKVSPMATTQSSYYPNTTVKNQAPVTPFIIYTHDFRDKEDVLRVGLALRKLGNIKQTISYKPDVFTTSVDGIYGSNQIPKSIYQLRTESPTVLTLTECSVSVASSTGGSTGKSEPNKNKKRKRLAYDIAVEMITAVSQDTYTQASSVASVSSVWSTAAAGGGGAVSTSASSAGSGNMSTKSTGTVEGLINVVDLTSDVVPSIAVGDVAAAAADSVVAPVKSSNSSSTKRHVADTSINRSMEHGNESSSSSSSVKHKNKKSKSTPAAAPERSGMINGFTDSDLDF